MVPTLYHAMTDQVEHFCSKTCRFEFESERPILVGDDVELATLPEGATCRQCNRKLSKQTDPHPNDIDWDTGGDDASPSNGKRADKGKEAVALIADEDIDVPEELCTYMGDLIADLMHLARREGIPWSEVLRKGRMHHDAERAGEL